MRGVHDLLLRWCTDRVVSISTLAVLDFCHAGTSSWWSCISGFSNQSMLSRYVLRRRSVYSHIHHWLEECCQGSTSWAQLQRKVASTYSQASWIGTTKAWPEQQQKSTWRCVNVLNILHCMFPVCYWGGPLGWSETHSTHLWACTGWSCWKEID